MRVSHRVFPENGARPMWSHFFSLPATSIGLPWPNQWTSHSHGPVKSTPTERGFRKKELLQGVGSNGADSFGATPTQRGHIPQTPTCLAGAGPIRPDQKRHCSTPSVRYSASGGWRLPETAHCPAQFQRRALRRVSMTRYMRGTRPPPVLRAVCLPACVLSTFFPDPACTCLVCKLGLKIVFPAVFTPHIH